MPEMSDEELDAEFAESNRIVRKAIDDCRDIIESAIESAPEHSAGRNGNLIRDAILDRLVAEMLDEGNLIADEHLCQLFIFLQVEAFMDLDRRVSPHPIVRHYYCADRMIKGDLEARFHDDEDEC